MKLKFPCHWILLLIVWCVVMEKVMSISEMQIQSGSAEMYNGSPDNYFWEYQNIPFTYAYSSFPGCFCGMKQMSTDENQTNVYRFNFLYRINYTALAYLKVYWYYDIYYTSSGIPNLGIKKFTLDWVCMNNYYSNLHSDYIYYSDYSSDGKYSRDFSHSVPITSTNNIINHYLNYLSIDYPFEIRTSLVFKNTSLLTLTAQSSVKNSSIYLRITYFIVNLEKFPQNSQYISSGTLQLTTQNTEINFDYQNHEITLFNFQSLEKGSGGFDINFDQSNTQQEKIYISISGLNSATIFYINFGTGSPLLENQMLQFCTSRNSQFLCTSCQTGYSLTSNPGSCRPSIDNCLSLDTSDYRLCDTCEFGHTLSSDQTQCTPNVEHCDIMRSFTECYKCDEWYVLMTVTGSGDILCIPCIPYCQAISSTNYDQCDRCYSDSYLTDDKRCYYEQHMADNKKCLKRTQSWMTQGIMVMMGCGLFLILAVILISVKIYKLYNLSETEKFMNRIKKQLKQHWKNFQGDMEKEAERNNKSKEEIQAKRYQSFQQQFQSMDNILPI